MENGTNMPYSVDFITFKVVDKKMAKRTAIQEQLLQPLRAYHQVMQVRGMGSEHTVFALEQFSLAEDKQLERKHSVFTAHTPHLHHLMIGAKWLQYLFLYGGALCHLLIYNLKGDEIYRVRHIRAVFHTSVEIQQAIMGIQATKQELHAKLLCTDVLDGTLVILIDSLHHQLY